MTLHTQQREPALTQKLYEQMYREALAQPDVFWATRAREFLTWFHEWSSVCVSDARSEECRWFDGGKINASFNCIDRHVEGGYGDQVAYHWESNEGQTVSITYEALLDAVSRLANVLISRGVKKGDRVCIYMPMIPEAVYAMLACARIGAVHTVVFAGFSSAALMSRINDASCVAVLTADVTTRGNKEVPLKERVDEVRTLCPSVHTCIVVQTGTHEVPMQDGDVMYHEAVHAASPHCPPEHMDAEDPLFILYTSGSTGKPKGVVHTTGGYLLYAAMTHRYVFNYEPGDVYWCTADIGWVTGHSYAVYGPLANRATSVMYEGVPTYPDASRYWQIVDTYAVNIFYSTPTTIRMLMGQGDEFVTRTSRKSLVILGTVGEPINPEAWRWYHDVVGNKECFIVDTWWQTETGGHALTPLPGVVTDLKPGSAMIPFFGIVPVIANEQGEELIGEAEGVLLLKGVWPGRMRDLYNDHERFLDTYMRPYPGYYFTGDGARRDADGHYWITGRVDDVMNIAGRLIGTAEVESALVCHPAVAEAAVVAVPHDVKGWAMHAFVCLVAGATYSTEMEAALEELVREHVGPFAKPDRILAVNGLPKTRSGKIMRRIIRKIASGEQEGIGDTSTLADPEVVAELIRQIAP